MTKLQGIIRYELLMAWRRRSLPVLILFFLAALLFIGVLVKDLSPMLESGVISVHVENGVTTVVRRVEDGSIVEEPLDAETASLLPEWLFGIDLDQAGRSLHGITVILPALMVIVVGILPLLSDTVALDRQYKVRELLDTKPLSRTTYLGGKVLSVWIGLSIGVIICMIAFQTLFYLLYGIYDLTPFLLLWAALIEPLILFVSAAAILLTSWAGTRRIALLAAVFLIPVAVYLYFLAIMSPLGNIARLVLPFYGLGLMDTYLNDPNYRSPLLIGSAETLLTLVLIGAAIWATAWGYARLREAR